MIVTGNVITYIVQYITLWFFLSSGIQHFLLIFFNGIIRLYYFIVAFETTNVLPSGGKESSTCSSEILKHIYDFYFDV